VAILHLFLFKFWQICFVFFIRNPLCKSKWEFLGESIVKTCSKKIEVCANHHFFGGRIFTSQLPEEKFKMGVWCHIFSWFFKERIAIFSTKKLKISAPYLDKIYGLGVVNCHISIVSCLSTHFKKVVAINVGESKSFIINK
jgi:hypothetical protein